MAEHGHSRYTNEKCRCDICRAANTARVARRRAERIAITRASGLPEGITHGENAYMNWGCRCSVCVLDRQKNDRARYAAKKARKAEAKAQAEDQAAA